MLDYEIRVRSGPQGTFVATLQRLQVSSHPEVRAVIGPVSRGEGANVPAAMVSAIARARIPQIPRTVARHADAS